MLYVAHPFNNISTRMFRIGFAELKAAEEDEEDEEAEEEEEEYGDDVVGDEEDVLNEDSFYMQNIDNSKTGALIA